MCDASDAPILIHVLEETPVADSLAGTYYRRLYKECLQDTVKLYQATERQGGKKLVLIRALRGAPSIEKS